MKKMLVNVLVACTNKAEESRLHCNNRDSQTSSLHLANLPISRVLAVDHVSGATGAEGRVDLFGAAAGSSTIRGRYIDEGPDEADI